MSKSNFNRINANSTPKGGQEVQQEQFKLLTLISNGSTDAIYVKDNRGRYLLFNKEAARVVGKEPSDVLGKDDYDIFPDHEAALIIAGDKKVMESGNTSTYEEVVTTVDGTKIFLSTKGPIFDSEGKVTGLFGIARDITERKRMEESLRKSEALMRIAIENLPLIFYMIDHDGKFRLSVGAGLKGLGLKQNQVVGQSAFDVYEAYPEITGSLRKSLAGETTTFESHVGGSSYFNVCVPFSSVIDGLVGIVAVALDITERKRAEEALKNMQKLDSLGVLAGGIAHDFNNLMGGIFGYIDNAIEESKNDSVTGNLKKAANTIERARALTQQLLTFAKGGAPIQKVDYLFPFVQETAAFALSGSNATCKYDIPTDLWACNYDKNQIGQVIDNIIINAQQAMPVGGTIELAARNVSFAEKEHPTLAKGDYIKISIKDCGIGIPKDLISKIFDPFFTTKLKGHGLGLATCYSIVNRHGGCIDVGSEQGKGSTFHVILPAFTESVSSVGGEAARTHKGSGTFLIMDDEEVMRETIQDMLASLGYTVVCKENGKDAVDFFALETKQNRKIAGAIFDLTIPGGMSGTTAVEEIRKSNVEIPVFVASGYAEDQVMKNPTEYGFTASICKPFRKSELSEMLSKYLKPPK